MSKTKILSTKIDHSILKPNQTLHDIELGCKVARKYQVAALCVRPADVAFAKNLLRGSNIPLAAVVGFPHGSSKVRTKEFELIEALKDGAREIDAVCHFSRAISGDWDYLIDEIEALTHLAHLQDASIKIIFETCYLDDSMILRLCEICTEAKVDFVKTSTGFGREGATFEHVQMMRRACPESIQVKASGGIRDLAMALQMVEAGADRIGTSATENILKETLINDHPSGTKE